MSGRWIKLYEKFSEWEWYADIPCKVIFLDLLLSANPKPKKYQGVEVPAGACVTGYDALAAKTGLTTQQVRTAFKKLLSSGEITVKKHPKFSIVSITNWEKYQPSNRQSTADQQQNNSRITVPLEYNNTNPNGLDAPSGVKEVLWRDGVASLRRQTGKSEGQCRSLIGKWLKTTKNDCPKVLTAIRQSEADRVIDPVSWITAAIQPKKLSAVERFGWA